MNLQCDTSGPFLYFSTILLGCDLELYKSNTVNVHVSINKTFPVLHLFRISQYFHMKVRPQKHDFLPEDTPIFLYISKKLLNSLP